MLCPAELLLVSVHIWIKGQSLLFKWWPGKCVGLEIWVWCAVRCLRQISKACMMNTAGVGKKVLQCGLLYSAMFPLSSCISSGAQKRACRVVVCVICYLASWKANRWRSWFKRRSRILLNASKFCMGFTLCPHLQGKELISISISKARCTVRWGDLPRFWTENVKMHCFGGNAWTRNRKDPWNILRQPPL